MSRRPLAACATQLSAVSVRQLKLHARGVDKRPMQILSRRSLRLLASSMLLAWAFAPASAPAQDATELAQCIADSGAIYYGAHWCPYCAKQTAAFGAAARHLPYVECYRAGTRKKLSRCAQIKTYPTWQLADGSIHKGLKSLGTLARLTGCRAP